MANSRRIKKRIKNSLIYLILRLFFTLIGVMNRRVAFSIFEALGLAAYCLTGKLRKRTFKQLKRVFGNQFGDAHIRKMAREVFLNLARNAVDAIRLRKYDPQTMDRLVRAEGLEKIDEVLKKGKGLILLTGHMGNWELLAAYMTFKGYPLHVIAAPLYDSRLDKLLVENRRHFGAQVIARGPSATRKILQALRKNEIIGILIDQDSKTYEGVFVDFMGKEAVTPAGPVFLATKTNTPLIPFAIHIEKDYRHVVEVGDEIKLEITGDPEKDVAVNAQRCSKAVENLILRHPTQWIWVHNRWKTKRITDT
jgi:KDO2-lipid IV(A) lauroyltransferase